jgi:hypothetical protein
MTFSQFRGCSILRHPADREQPTSLTVAANPNPRVCLPRGLFVGGAGFAYLNARPIVKASKAEYKGLFGKKVNFFTKWRERFPVWKTLAVWEISSVLC